MDSHSPAVQDALDAEMEAIEARIAARDRAIAERSQQNETDRRENEVDRHVLRGMHMAAELRPASLSGTVQYRPWDAPGASTTAYAATSQPKRRGKAPGTLSMKWQDTMEKVVEGGNPYLGPTEWSILAQESGMPAMTAKAANDWLRRTATREFGYIQRSADGKAYRVGVPAIEKFKFRFGNNVPEPPPEGSSDGSA
jgi:hypothetical protein